VAFPVTGNLQRIDRVDLVAGRDQSLHPRTAFGLDPDHDCRLLVILADVRADQRVQPRYAATPSGSFALPSTRPASSCTSTS
jgi:hypothetical protein